MNIGGTLGRGGLCLTAYPQSVQPVGIETGGIGNAVVIRELFEIERGGDFHVVVADPGESINGPAPAQEDRRRGWD
jgi:hypothetical protein